MYNKILLCYDATEEGRRALRQGADIAAAMNADTFLLARARWCSATPSIISRKPHSASGPI